MIKKIKKFRVKPRVASVLRGLKALTREAKATVELEKAVEQEVKDSESRLATAAVYSTYNMEQSPEWANTLWDARSEAGAKPVALTFLAATIGGALEEELSLALGRSEILRSQILTSLGEELAEQAGGFVQRLILDEAKEESCEISLRLNPSPEQQREILGLLEASKIQVQAGPSGQLLPRFSRVNYVLWWPPAKRRPVGKEK